MTHCHLDLMTQCHLDLECLRLWPLARVSCLKSSYMSAWPWLWYCNHLLGLSLKSQVLGLASTSALELRHSL